MGALSDVVTVTVSVQAVTPNAPGFGVPLIISAGDAPAGFTQRTRYYSAPGPTGLAQMVTDGFSATSPTYLAVQAAFSQSPCPSVVGVGRFVNLPTQMAILTPTYISGYNYSVEIDGQTATGVGLTNLATTCTAIATAINALTFSPAHLTATGESTYVKIACSVAGEWHRYANLDLTGNLLLTIINNNDPTGAAVTDTASLSNSGTVAAELAAIGVADSSGWYALCLDAWPSAHMISAGATFVDARANILVTQSNDTGCATNAESSGTDIMQTLQAATVDRAAVMFCPDGGGFAGAAWLGARLPYAPGSENWKFATLVGVTVSNLSAQQVLNIIAKNGNYYYTVGGVAITAAGNMAANGAGFWIDLVRGVDWFVSTLQTRIFGVLTSTGQKVPFTDQGVAQIEAELRAVIDQGIQAKFIAPTPKPVVTAQLVASLNPTDVANRLLKGLAFNFTAAGAIDTVAVSGVVLQ